MQMWIGCVDCEGEGAVANAHRSWVLQRVDGLAKAVPVVCMLQMLARSSSVVQPAMQVATWNKHSDVLRSATARSRDAVVD